jgi:glycine/sarcosine/betaine reductase complex component A
VVDKQGTDNLVVVLGSPSVESAEIYALTVTEGDPSWVGPLAGVSLGLPVYHVLEPEMKSQFDPQVYESQVAIMESVLETDAIIEAVRAVRAGAGDGSTN